MLAVHCRAHLWSTLIVNVLSGKKIMANRHYHLFIALVAYHLLEKLKFSENPLNFKVDYITKQLIHGSLCNIRFVLTQPQSCANKSDVT